MLLRDKELSSLVEKLAYKIKKFKISLYKIDIYDDHNEIDFYIKSADSAELYFDTDDEVKNLYSCILDRLDTLRKQL